jgi:class 3 adenylate cyclase/tetratricopeptide (TPR) repeat protein
MKCPHCHFENPEGAKFCNECGKPMAPGSEHSSQFLSFEKQLEKIQQYLPDGLTEKIINQKDKIEGERKQVTVMFCDMVGFTPLVDRIGEVDAYGVMDKVYEILIRQVHELEGTVNQMTGDGVMALFGAPIALEDAPQRALRAAVSIHREIARFSDQNEKIGPLRMRIGINTGPVVVGTLGKDLRVEFKAVGDTVNLASRMESLAEPGTTYVTEETFRLTQDLFRFKTLGKKTVKGKKGGTPVYRVQSARQDIYRPRLGSERMIYSDMVGRDSELDKVELQLMKVINGEGSIINIIGEAGIGKSRLVAELKRRDVMKRVSHLEGRAISMGRNLSFHPFIDLLKQWARIRKDDEEMTAFGKLEAAVRTLCPGEVTEIVPFLATLMGMKLFGRYEQRMKGIEGEALQKLIRKNARELFTRGAEQTPLVIIMEDLHWADASSIELLESLFRLAETQRILFINVFRPEFQETGERIIKTIREKLSVYYVEITLGPLNEKKGEALIANMLNVSGGHHAVIGQIVQRASGNPFFIEEVVRSFIDEGAVVLRNGKFEVTDKINTIAIPHTIHDVLMARIDRLEEKTRNLVKVASVIGRNFFYRILSEAASTIQDIDKKLSYLKDTQLIRERQRMEELEYLFKHALAQEATYLSILPPKRKELHLKVADSIEKVFGEKLHEFYGMLAYHYSRAENLDKAEEALIKAGEEALKSSASNEALNYYQEALALYLRKYGESADADKMAMLEKNIALALYNRGQYDEALEYFDKALNHYWGRLPKNRLAQISKVVSAFVHLLITLYLPSFKFRKTPTQRDAEVVDLFYKKIKALAIIDPMRFFFEYLYLYKGATNFDLKKFELGLEIFIGASALFSFTGISFGLSRKILDSARRRVGGEDAKIIIWNDLLNTIHNYLKGNWQAINGYSDELVNKSLESGEIYDAVQHMYWHGFVCIYQGAFDITESIVNKLNEIYEIYEHDLSKYWKHELNTNLLIERRQLNAALNEVNTGIEFGEAADNYHLLEMYACQAWIHTLLGNMETAELALKQADKLKSEADAPVPFQLSSYCRSQLEFELYRLGQSVQDGHKNGVSGSRKRVVKSDVKNCRKSGPASYRSL